MRALASFFPVVLSRIATFSKGSHFRLSLNSQCPRTQQTERDRLRSFAKELASVAVHCGSKEPCTRDASLSAVVAWKQERSIFNCFLLPVLVGVSDS